MRPKPQETQFLLPVSWNTCFRVLCLVTQPLYCDPVWQPQLSYQPPVTITASHAWAIWTSRPFVPWDDCSQYMIVTTWKTPNENHAAEPSHPTATWQVIINYCSEAKSFEVCYTAISGWWTMEVQWLRHALYSENGSSAYKGPKIHWCQFLPLIYWYDTELSSHFLFVHFLLVSNFIFFLRPYFIPFILFHSQTKTLCLIITFFLWPQ